MYTMHDAIIVLVTVLQLRIRWEVHCLFAHLVILRMFSSAVKASDDALQTCNSD